MRVRVDGFGIEAADRSWQTIPPATNSRRGPSAPEESLLAEFWGFLKTNKKYWLLPILTVLLMMGMLVVLSSSGAAPFIYTLF